MIVGAGPLMGDSQNGWLIIKIKHITIIPVVPHKAVAEVSE